MKINIFNYFLLLTIILSACKSKNAETLFLGQGIPNDLPIPFKQGLVSQGKLIHIWYEPLFVDIPNLKDKLVSHPTITNSGKLYFHTSNLDYSEMDIYHSKQVNGKFEKAEKASIAMNPETGKCTPYVSPNEDYLIFASIGKELDLMISYNNGKGDWVNTKKLNDRINNQGQGNPFVTPDNRFLFFTSGKESDQDWSVKWVNVESEINSLYK
jgi:hypothetical protein